jgi:hypothetical protein
MNYFFHPDAESEFNKSIDYYNQCRQGLGYEFALEVHSTIDRILYFPEAWPIVKFEIRRCLTNRFPYGVIYSIEKESFIYILSIMHLHREPDYWVNRLTP